MFIWVTQGIVEPYIPKVRPDTVKKINPTHRGIPDKSIEVGDPEDTIVISHNKTGFASDAYIDVADIYSQEQSILKEERKQIFYAKDIMTKKVKCIAPDDLVTKVEEIFQEDRFKHMPVVDSNQFIQGILSERDLLKFTIELLRKTIENNQAKVQDIMQRKVLSAYPETPIREIARIMFEEKVGSVPILDKEKKTFSRNCN